MNILSGTLIAQQIKQEVSRKVNALSKSPCLAVILVGNDPASHIYIKNKEKSCTEVGIATKEIFLPEDTKTHQLIEVIQELNNNASVHGILVQLPLPAHINKFEIFDVIDPYKDVDVFTPENTGLLIQNRPRLVPCTPQAVREILIRSNVSIKGQNVVVVNRSLIVGQPLAHMLMQNDDFANATVTVCHEYTKNIKNVTKTADILITAVGRRDQFVVTGDMVKLGATVIDVAIIHNGKRVVGDVDFDDVSKVAGNMTKVPGGVGVVTCACLLNNVVQAYSFQTR